MLAQGVCVCKVGREESAVMSSVDPSNPMAMPPGILTGISDWVYSQSYLPVQPIANFAAISLLSGLAGRAYNTSTGAGLNQYMLMLARTGRGKESIAEGISKLLAAVQRVVPAAADFKGPGELVSSAGLIKWLDRNPCVLSIVGEFGVRFQAMVDSRAAPSEKSLQRTLLQLYSKSGLGSVFDPIAYSDKEKNTAPIHNPSLTIVGEGVPETFYSSLDEGMISSGLLPRFMVFEYLGERPYSNADKQSEPCPLLVQSLADFTGHCLNLMHLKQAIRVPTDGNAHSLLQAFEDDECREAVNCGNQVVGELWNRAHLKALKLASLSAISRFPYNPTVCREDAVWALSLVRSQTERLVGKFERDEVGVADGDEGKQLAELIKAIGRYYGCRFDELSGYGGFSQEMHRDGVITESFLSRFLTKRAAFRNDRRRGPTEALKRALNNLVSGDELREMPRAQMLAKYGNQSRSFVVSDPKRFAAARSAELEAG